MLRKISCNKSVTFLLQNNNSSSEDVVEEVPSGITSKQKTGSSYDVKMTEATQTSEPAPEYVVNAKALQIWLLSKKHRSYQQRATMRAAHIQDLLEEAMTPIWCIRKDAEPRPQYIELTAPMLALTKRHAREIAEQARLDLLQRSEEEGARADEYLTITHGIYAKHKDNNAFKAEARIVEILGKYKVQEKKKFQAALEREREAFPKDDAGWEKSLFDAAKPGSSRRRQSRSASGERKRRRESASRQTPPTPAGQGTSASTQAVANVTGKGKSGPNQKAKNSGSFQNQGTSSTARSDSVEPSTQRGRSADRGHRGAPQN